MVKVRAFRGFLANKEHAHKIICPPYDAINTKEARAISDGNPMSFLHCEKPEVEPMLSRSYSGGDPSKGGLLTASVDPYSDIVYQTGKQNLHKFIIQNWL